MNSAWTGRIGPAILAVILAVFASFFWAQAIRIPHYSGKATGTLIFKWSCTVSYTVNGEEHLVDGRDAGKGKDPVCLKKQGSTTTVFYDRDHPERADVDPGTINRVASGILAVLLSLFFIGAVLVFVNGLRSRRRENALLADRARRSGVPVGETTTVYYTAGPRVLALSPARVTLAPGEITIVDYADEAKTFSTEHRKPLTFTPSFTGRADAAPTGVYVLQGKRSADIRLDALTETDRALVMQHLEAIGSRRSNT